MKENIEPIHWIVDFGNLELVMIMYGVALS